MPRFVSSHGALCRAYQQARGDAEPLPDCNRYLKFGLLETRARALGCDAGDRALCPRRAAAGRARYTLKKAVDTTKDQSLRLLGSRREQLAHTRFPLAGGLHKTEA